MLESRYFLLRDLFPYFLYIQCFLKCLRNPVLMISHNNMMTVQIKFNGDLRVITEPKIIYVYQDSIICWRGRNERIETYW